jgi:putative ABC transport system permease protein
METLLQDLQYGLRAMRKSPLFAVAAILILAFGCAVNTAIFSIVNAVVIQPLPFKDPDRLVALWEKKQGGPEWFGVSPANYMDWKEQASIYQSMAAVRNWNVSYTSNDGGVPLLGIRSTADFFPMLGVEPSMGRLFTAQEDQPGSEHVVLLTYPFWKRAFAGDPQIVGKSIRLNREEYTVIGVLPASFQFASQQVELFAPLAMPHTNPDRASRDNLVFARLKPEATIESARTQLETIAGRLEQQYPDANRGYSAAVYPMHDFFANRRNLKSILLIVQLSVGFLLLISCANIANLLLVRTAERQREFTIRVALGANRRRMIRQMLTESMLLAIVSGIVGLGLSVLFFKLLVQITPYIPTFRPNAIVIDSHVLIFTLAVSIATGLVFGLVPAVQASRTDVNQTLKESGRSGSSSAAARRARNVLVVLQISLAMVLLICATLVTKSFMLVQRVSPGFQPANVMTMQVLLSSQQYRTPADYSNFFEKLLRNVRALPGVESAGATSQLPLAGIAIGTSAFTLEGQPAPRPGQEPTANNRIVDPEYFHSIGVPLLKGRPLAEQDDDKSLPIAVVNQAFARRFLPEQNVIGARVKMGAYDSQSPWYVIVGVVGDVKDVALDLDPNPEIYRSFRQAPAPAMALTVRSKAESASLTRAVRSEVSKMDRDIPLAQVRTMNEILATSVAPRRFSMLLLNILSLSAFVLAVAGVYSVISYSVAQQRQEIGIRLALGAQAKDIFRLILGQTALLIAIGVGIGLVFALMSSRFMSKLLYDVSATDITSWVAVVAAIFLAGQFAGFIPTWRATKVDPKIVLQVQ